MLDAGDRIAIPAGQGATATADELLAVSDRLGAGPAKALLGKAVLADDLPLVTGAVGHLGTTASVVLAELADQEPSG